MLTEDIDSALRAVKKNVKAVHEINCVSYELAPSEFQGFWRQRLRWAQGWAQASLVHIPMVSPARARRYAFEVILIGLAGVGQAGARYSELYEALRCLLAASCARVVVLPYHTGKIGRAPRPIHPPWICPLLTQRSTPALCSAWSYLTSPRRRSRSQECSFFLIRYQSGSSSSGKCTAYLHHRTFLIVPVLFAWLVRWSLRGVYALSLLVSV
jgi:hypothetical protein